MAIRAVQVWVLTALGLVPRNVFSLRFCFIALKKSSTAHLASRLISLFLNRNFFGPRPDTSPWHFASNCSNTVWYSCLEHVHFCTDVSVQALDTSPVYAS